MRHNLEARRRNELLKTERRTELSRRNLKQEEHVSSGGEQRWNGQNEWNQSSKAAKRTKPKANTNKGRVALQQGKRNYALKNYVLT